MAGWLSFAHAILRIQRRTSQLLGKAATQEVTQEGHELLNNSFKQLRFQVVPSGLVDCWLKYSHSG